MSLNYCRVHLSIAWSRPYPVDHCQNSLSLVNFFDEDNNFSCVFLSFTYRILTNIFSFILVMNMCMSIRFGLNTLDTFPNGIAHNQRLFCAFP